MCYDLTNNTAGTVAPLQIKVQNRYGSGQEENVGMVSIPAGFPYLFLLSLLFTILAALIIILVLHSRKKKKISELEIEHEFEKTSYEQSIKGFQDNLNVLESELEKSQQAGNIDGISDSNDVISFDTRIVDPRLESTILLKFEKGCLDQEIIEITSLPVNIGKHADNDVCLKNATVSKVHAVLVNENDQFFVVDQNSTNGIWVNNIKVKRQMIKDGDVLQFGKCRCQFNII